MLYVNTVFMLNITINVSLSLNSGVKYFVSKNTISQVANVVLTLMCKYICYTVYWLST